MNLSDMPALVGIPFGNNAGASYIRQVPVASQIGISAGSASFTDGFTPDTFTPLSGGGAYVNGEDMNGILNHVTKWTRWLSAGGPAVFSAALATAMTGYPKGAQVVSTAFNGTVWLNTVDGNVTDPDGGAPAGWIVSGVAPATLAQAEAGTAGGVFMSPLILAELFNSGDAQTLVLPGGRIIKMGVLPCNHGGGSVTTTPLVFATPFPTSFGGIVGIPNMAASPSKTGVSVTGEGFTVAGGSIVLDTNDSTLGITNALSTYWIAWGR